VREPSSFKNTSTISLSRLKERSSVGVGVAVGSLVGVWLGVGRGVLVGVLVGRIVGVIVGAAVDEQDAIRIDATAKATILLLMVNLPFLRVNRVLSPTAAIPAFAFL
jgi:hypothetical protein